MFVAIQSAWAAPAISVEFSDSDGIVADGTSVMVYVRDASTGTDDTTSGWTIDAVTVSGELAGTELPGVDVAGGAAILAKGAAQATPALTITIPKGTAHGKYTVTATVGLDADDDVSVSDSATLEVGEPGTGVASVEIAFNKSHIATANVATGTRTCGPAPAHAGTTPTEDEIAQDKTERTDDASAPADEPICLTATVKNSLGATANTADVKLLFITAEGGMISGAGDQSTATANALTVNDANRASKYSFSVTKGTAGQVTVEVDAGPADNTVELTFTGSAAALSIGDASDVLARSDDAYTAAVPDDTTTADVDESKDAIEGGVIFEVMATDKAGNNVDLAPDDVTAVKITDSNDKDVTSKFNTDNEMQKAGNPQVVLVRVGTGATKVDAGEYTVSVSLTEVADSAETSTFRVADVPADVSLSASAMTSSTIGEVITVTATVTDESGNTVADGTDVDFDVSANTGLAGIGKGHGANDTVDTKGGTASVKYAVVGAGTSVVSATAGGATGVVVIVSTAGTADAADDEPALSDFANGGRPGLTSYTGPDTTASELLALLVGRANAIWLSSGDGWVLYASADGSMVPGSMNFTVTSGDVIYISN